jgi:hypothetical protein
LDTYTGARIHTGKATRIQSTAAVDAAGTSAVVLAVHVSTAHNRHCG